MKGLNFRNLNFFLSIAQKYQLITIQRTRTNINSCQGEDTA